MKILEARVLRRVAAFAGHIHHQCRLAAQAVQDIGAAVESRHDKIVKKVLHLCPMSRAAYAARSRFFRCTSSSETAAGVSPGIRAACPKVSGRTSPSRSRASFDSPPTCE